MLLNIYKLFIINFCIITFLQTSKGIFVKSEMIAKVTKQYLSGRQWLYKNIFTNSPIIALQQSIF